MKPITYKLIRPESEIGFEKIELVAITNENFWFKCYYEVVHNGVVTTEIDLLPFDHEDYSTIHSDYKIVE